MSAPGLPDFVYAGTAKAASTWIYECLLDHPEVAIHEETDSLNFFDVNHHRGVDWYRDRFPPAASEAVGGETTTSYLHDTHAVERIADLLPDATLLFNLRNPVDRAFSQWWHGESRGYTNYDFEEVLESYPPYQMWAVPGFYATHLQRFDRHFDADQMHVLLFDDLVADDQAFIQDVFARVGVDDSYVPAPLDEKSNTARTRYSGSIKQVENWVGRNFPEPVKDVVRPAWNGVQEMYQSPSAYEEGMDPAVRRELEQMFAPDVKRLSERLDRDLSHWLEHVSLDEVEPIPADETTVPSA